MGQGHPSTTHRTSSLCDSVSESVSSLIVLLTNPFHKARAYRLSMRACGAHELTLGRALSLSLRFRSGYRPTYYLTSSRTG